MGSLRRLFSEGEITSTTRSGGDQYRPSLMTMLSRRKTAMSGLRQVSGSRLIIRRLARSLNRQLDEARAIGKLEDYAGIGVPEAWLLSPEAQSVEIRRLIEGKLATTALLVAGDLHPTRFPEVAIPVGSVWPEEILKS